MPSSFSLGAHFEDFVKTLVQTGRYASASEVIRDSLRLLENAEQLRDLRIANLRAEIQKGLDSGTDEPLDMAEIKAEARRRRDVR